MIFDLFQDSTAVGISESGGVIKIVRAAKRKGGVAILSFDTIPFEANVKRLDISPNDLFASATKGQSTLSRNLEIPLKKDKDIESAVLFQAEPLLPFPPEEAVISYSKLGTTEKGTILNLFAIQKTELKKHLDHLETIGIEPEIVTSPAEALSKLSDSLSSHSGTLPSIVLHIGIEETLCVLEQGGKTLGMRAIDSGTSSLAKKLESGKLEEIDIASEQSIKEPLDALKNEISRAIFSLLKQFKTQKISRLLLTGHGGTLKGIGPLIAHDLQIEVVAPEAAFGQPSEVIQEFAIPVGLILLSFEEKPVNFRKDEFSYPDPWKRLKLPLATFFAGALAMTLSLYFLSSIWNGERQKNVAQSYADTLKIIEKPYQEFEKRFPDNKPPLKLTEEDLETRIEALSDAINNTPEPYELLPDVPRVSDLLAWLATHEKVVNGEPIIDITNLQYTLVKRPEDRKKSERYKVKVELEFTAKSPKYAREFHDALIAPNTFVDPKGEVKWGAAGNGWRTSFFLKNKPPRKAP